MKTHIIILEGTYEDCPFFCIPGKSCDRHDNKAAGEVLVTDNEGEPLGALGSYMIYRYGTCTDENCPFPAAEEGPHERT